MKKQPRSQNVQATPPPAPEPTPRLAPEGVFFLTQYVSLTTRSGVIGFEPGQRVKFVRGKETTLIVTDGKYEIEVTPDQLTNDLDLADLARRNDQTSQALLASRAAANLAAYQQDQKAEDARNAAAQQQANRERRGPGVGGGSAALNGGPEFSTAAEKAVGHRQRAVVNNPYYYLRRY